jgi:hypothetical protein
MTRGRFPFSDSVLSAAGVFASIVKSSPQVASISVERYSAPPDVITRVRAGRELNAAVREAAEPKLPFHFWDRFLYAAVHYGVPPQEVIAFVEFRNPPDEPATSLTRRAVLAGHLSVLAERSAHDRLNVLSRVRLRSGVSAHFAMLDFSGTPTNGLRRLVLGVAARLLPDGGFLLDSGRSFHAIGSSIISSRRRRRLYADSLFYCPLVDRMYVAHQLRRSTSSMRISSSAPGTRPPYVVSTF